MYGTLDEPSLRAANGTAPGQQAQLRHTSAAKSKRFSHCHLSADELELGGASEPERGQVDSSARRRLLVASALCLVFMVAEIVGGTLSNSLAIATDAAHLLADLAGFMVSLLAMWISARPASRRMSFGWYRAEVIGALLSVFLIWLVTGLLVFMAANRLIERQFEIDSTAMVATASMGLVINIIMGLALNVGDGDGAAHAAAPEQKSAAQPIANSLYKSADVVALQIEPGPADKQKAQFGRGKDNINVRAATIHVIGDFLQSLGVLAASLVIYFEPSYAIVDPICTFMFSIIVLITTFNMIRDAINVLMEGIPDCVEFNQVQRELQALPAVVRVHHLRIWSLSLDKTALSAHLVIDAARTNSAKTIKVAIERLKKLHNFFEITLQVEDYKDEMANCTKCHGDDSVDSALALSYTNGALVLH